MVWRGQFVAMRGTMFLIYVGFQTVSAYVFAVALFLLIISLFLSVWEIQILPARWKFI
jgi:hypothetical protein